MGSSLAQRVDARLRVAVHVRVRVVAGGEPVALEVLVVLREPRAVAGRLLPGRLQLRQHRPEPRQRRLPLVERDRVRVERVHHREQLGLELEQLRDARVLLLAPGALHGVFLQRAALPVVQRGDLGDLALHNMCELPSFLADQLAHGVDARDGHALARLANGADLHAADVLGGQLRRHDRGVLGVGRALGQAWQHQFDYIRCS